jgi:hypothetical protein
MSQSIPFQLSAAVIGALREQLEADGVVVRDNPTSRTQLDTGPRVVFIEDADDDLLNKPGQAEGRTFGFVIGVINRTDDPRAGADADMQRAKGIATQALLAACRALQATKDIATFQAPREGRRTYRHEHIDVGGALILTRYEIDYRLPAVRG